MTKLPKAAIETTAFSRDSSTQSYYTEAQMLQFRRDALEEAITSIQTMREGWGDPAEECGMNTSIREIRKLKDET